MLETIKGYKTVIFNVTVGLLMVWRATDQSVVLPDETQVNAALDAVFSILDPLAVVGNMVLRAVTNTAVGKKY